MFVVLATAGNSKLCHGPRIMNVTFLILSRGLHACKPTVLVDDILNTYHPNQTVGRGPTRCPSRRQDPGVAFRLRKHDYDSRIFSRLQKPALENDHGFHWLFSKKQMTWIFFGAYLIIGSTRTNREEQILDFDWSASGMPTSGSGPLKAKWSTTATSGTVRFPLGMEGILMIYCSIHLVSCKLYTQNDTWLRSLSIRHVLPVVSRHHGVGYFSIFTTEYCPESISLHSVFMLKRFDNTTNSEVYKNPFVLGQCFCSGFVAWRTNLLRPGT
jgi:hypothetical protein